ncbi:Wzz/FepE/Etk N-terminal domain-containing protein [Salinibacterium sp. SYSU T00001]|uniref:Wzz/FepE/Etk N-terminal domain-containing protein n=1 Tax=Homoserinimonas sedimenticola TaxID=2986805 RepID=UPI0022360634|nr:Wzz/FepE/Etk N-terminal domain-containing protein [Salinibacterium sedimenticola]MCW4385028.1 Wzz/FepE/Etk N-terminal domain-containing protein [Salinibacterium sedimenticola]
MTARDLLRVVREGWAIILAVTVLFAAAAYAYAATRTPTYESAATLLVSACTVSEDVEVCDPAGGTAFAVERARIYASVGTTGEVLDGAAEYTDAVDSGEALIDVVTVRQATDSALLTVRATASTAEDAADIANAVALSLIEYVDDTVEVEETDRTRVQFAVIGEADPPSGPSESIRQTVVLAAILGIFIGLALALLRWYLNTRIRDAQEAEAIAGTDVLAELRFAADDVPVSDRDSDDAFHQLRTVIAARLTNGETTGTTDEAPRIPAVVVLSPGDDTLTPHVTRRLAASFASTRARVGVLSLHDGFDAAANAVDLRESLGREDAAAAGPVGDALVMTYSTRGEDTSVLLGTKAFSAFLEQLRTVADVVLIDAAANGPQAELTGAARVADGALVVVEAGRTRRQELEGALRSLDLVGVPVLGLATVNRSN